jgi:hypothetical protein
MVVNESFLDSATLRENVVSLARNIGYVPKSRSAAKASVTLISNVNQSSSSTLTLKKGLVCVGNANDTSSTFSILEDIQRPTNIENVNSTSRVSAIFENIEIYEGTFLEKKFIVDSSLDQKFVLNNSFIDTSTIKVYVKKEADTGLGTEYKLINNITNITGDSRVYLIQEVQDEKYELLFGDGLIGTKLETGEIITVNYLVTDGKDGNGASIFAFSGNIVDSNGNSVSPEPIAIITNQSSQNGGDIESVDSVKYFAPRIYSAQNRAVTGRDYESIVKTIYPDTESVSIVGGEELDPPEFGTVQISIKPKNGFLVSEFNKSIILSKLKQYSISGINQKIVDLKILYVEIESFIYYNDSMISTPENLKSKVINTLTSYSKSTDMNKFGGRMRYSQVLRTIDNTDTSITSNITRVTVRRNLFALFNQFAQYELCFGNQFHVSEDGKNIKSTGFRISGESDIVYLTDVPNEDKKTGLLSIVKDLSDGTIRVISKSAGTVDYIKGEINLGTINIVSTVKPNNVIEIQAFPESNDVVGLRDLYLNFDITTSKINMIKDVISSGDEISGTVFNRDFYTSSYSNGSLIRK